MESASRTNVIIPEMPHLLSSKFIDQLRATSPEQIQELVGKHLSKTELEGLLNRREAMLIHARSNILPNDNLFD